MPYETSVSTLAQAIAQEVAALVKMHPSLGVSVLLSNSDMAKIGHKYLYVHDDRIVGHASNSDIGTASGIQHANNHFVLRYVLGE